MLIFMMESDSCGAISRMGGEPLPRGFDVIVDFPKPDSHPRSLY